MIKHLFTREGTESNNDRIKMENFYYTATYGVLQEPDQHTSKTLAMRRLKAKIIRLNSIHSQRLLVDTGEQDRIMGKEPSLHHLLKARKHQARRLTKQIYEDNSTLQTSSTSIMKFFSTRFHAKYQPIQIDKKSISQLADCGIETFTPEINAVLKEPVPLEELRHATTQRRAYKAPGYDGICLQFFTTAWDVLKLDLLQIMNHMHIEGRTTARQMQGLIVCLPKNAHPNNADNYTPLKLLNADYKILARIIANRLRPCLTAILHPNQHCGIQGNSAFEAVASVREAFAHAEVTKTPLCIMSFDFSDVFDKISHS